MPKLRWSFFRPGLTGLSLFASILLALLVPARPSQADDVRPLMERVDRLERDLNQLQRQVYRNQAGTAPTPSGNGDGSPALDAQIRMDQLEAQLRTMTGQIEEMQYNLSQLSSRVEKTQGDNEVRFQQLEHGGPQSAAEPPPSAQAPAVAVVVPPPAPIVMPAPIVQAPPPTGRSGNSAADLSRPAPAAGVLVAPPAAVLVAPPPGAVQAQQAIPGGGTLPDGSAVDQYNYAFGLMRAADYRGAEIAFRGFLQKHPSDPLASNAQYWLGETFFVRGEYPAAAQAFAEGYQHYPQGPKAADNLLKLGMSLGNSGRKSDACFSFARLERDFPQMPAIIKDREASEKKRLGC
jgi:tol-pal system protein YbgF